MNSTNELSFGLREITRKAFISHGEARNPPILSLLRTELRRYEICDEDVFFSYVEAGDDKDENIENHDMNELLASEYLVVFLTHEFLRKTFEIRILKTFLRVMEVDKRRKLLPVFYRISGEECKDIFEGRIGRKLGGLELGPIENNEELKQVLKEVRKQVGIDAEGQSMHDAGVVERIMEVLFGIDAQHEVDIAREVYMQHLVDMQHQVDKGHEIHDSVTYRDLLCDYPTFVNYIKSSLDKVFSVPPLPRYTRLDFETPQRPERMLRDKLLSGASKAVAAVGDKRMGGTGKTTCLIGVASDPQIKETFTDGILWIQLSNRTTSEDMERTLVNVLKHAVYHRRERNMEIAWSPHTLLNDVVVRTWEELREKGYLIVFDDFRAFRGYERSIDRLMQILSPSCKILLSTQDREVVEEFKADQINIGDLDDETASSLFDDWCGGRPMGHVEESLKMQILGLCANVALAVRIAGSTVKEIAECSGKKRGLEGVAGGLRKNLSNFQKAGYKGGVEKLNAAAIQTSLNLAADESWGDRYRHLAVFNSTTQISSQALEALWATDEATVESHVDFYIDRSLAMRKIGAACKSSNSFYVEFHNEHLEYARYIYRRANELGVTERKMTEKLMARLHEQLVNGYKELHSDGSADVLWELKLLKDAYFRENYARHLAGCGRLTDLFELLMDFRWIMARCERQEMPGLLEDFDLAMSVVSGAQNEKRASSESHAFKKYSAVLGLPSNVIDKEAGYDGVYEALYLVREALQACQVALWEHSEETSFQLVGRLRIHTGANAHIEKFLKHIQQRERQAWLCPKVQCFEASVGRMPRVLHPGTSATSVAICLKKPRLVACGTRDGRVFQFDWSIGSVVWLSTGHSHAILSVAMASTGSVIVSGSVDSTVRVWDVQKGHREIAVLRGHEDRVNSVGVTDDESIVVSGSDDKTIRLWSMKSGNCKIVLRDHLGPVRSLAVTVDGSVVLSGSYDALVRLWDVKSGICKRLLQGHDKLVRSVAVTKDGSVAASGSDDGTVRVWDAKNGDCKGVLRGHCGRVSSVALTEDGGTVISGSDDRTVRCWNAKNGDCKRVFQGHHDPVRSVAAMEDGSALMSWSDDNTIRLWSAERMGYHGALRGHEELVTSIAITEDGSCLVSGSTDNAIRLWSVQNGMCKSVLRGHEGAVVSVEAAEGANILVSGSFDCTVRLWNLERGVCECVFRGHEDWVRSVSVTGDGSVAVSGSDDKTVQLWDVKKRLCRRVFRGHTGWVRSVAVTKDGNVVVSGSDDKTVRLWSAKREFCKSILHGHEDQVSSVAVNRDGIVVVSGSRDKTVRLWDVEYGKCEHVLRGHKERVISVAVSQDGAAVVSGSGDSTVRLWDAKTGGCLRTVGWAVGNPVTFGSQDLLRWTRMVGLLAASGAADLKALEGSSDAEANSIDCKFEWGAIRITYGGDIKPFISATFDGIVSFAPIIDSKCGRIALVNGRDILTLEVVNRNHAQRIRGFSTTPIKKGPWKLAKRQERVAVRRPKPELKIPLRGRIVDRMRHKIQQAMQQY